MSGFDASTIRKALRDFVNFSQDFYVRNSPTGFHVELADRVSTAISPSLVNYLAIAQSVSGVGSYFTSGTFAAVDAALTANKSAVDTACASNFQTNYNNGDWSEGVIQSATFPYTIVFKAKKQISLTLFGSSYQGRLDETRYQPALLLEYIPSTSTPKFRIFWRLTKTKIENGITTNTVTTGSVITNSTTTGIQLANLAGYPDITAEAWPSNPPVTLGTNSLTITYEITNITRTS